MHSLLDPAGDDPRQRFVAAAQKNDQNAPVLHILSLDQGSGGVRTLGGHTLSAVIEVLELLRVLQRADGILLHEQFQAPVSCVQPSGRVETWPEYKSRVVTGQGRLRETGHTDQSLQSKIIREGSFSQSFPHNDPVLITQRHHIADCSDTRKRDQIAPEFPEFPAVFSAHQLLRQQQADLKRHHCAAYIGKRIG